MWTSGLGIKTESTRMDLLIKSVMVSLETISEETLSH